AGRSLAFLARALRGDGDHPSRGWAFSHLAAAMRLDIELPHQNDVVAAAFSPDGTRGVTASRDRTARIWEARTGEGGGGPVEHGDAGRAAVFSADGTRVLTACDDGTARIWDAKTGQTVGVALPHGRRVTVAAFSTDATRVVTASRDGTARIWDARTGQPVG